jgi:2-keto-4-pentenoate hydratase
LRHVTSETGQTNITRIASAFVTARRNATALVEYPGTMPAALAEAYAMQDAAIALTDKPIAGWKVGRINPPIEGTDRLAGPIFADQTFDAGATPRAMPVFKGGFAAAEAEFLLRIGTAPDPAKHAYTLAEATALIDRVCVGIEIASSPFGGINDHGAGVTISDFGNNNGLVIGADVADWRDLDLNAWDVELTIDGVSTGVATAATMLDGPFGAARFLFELMAARGIALSAGQWISTGAVSGVHPVAVGAQVVAIFDDKLRVECSISAQ